MTMTRSAIPLMLILAVWLPMSAHGQQMYKWVDAQGNVHYSDRVPPTEVGLARERFNSQGIVVEEIARAPTAEEIAAEQAERQRLQDLARERERQMREERRLLKIYATEDDIQASRDQQIAAIDGAIRATRAFIDGETRTLAQLMERAARSQARKQSLDDNLLESISVSREQIAKQEAYIARKQEERAEVFTRFEAEIERYREARENQSGNS